MMQSQKMTVPEGWDRRPEDECDSDIVAEWVRETGAKRKFTVQLYRASTDQYFLNLSTTQHQNFEGRKDYRVGEYDEKPTAMGDAERFIKHLANEMECGTLSKDLTSASATSRAVWDFKGGDNWLAKILFRFYG